MKLIFSPFSPFARKVRIVARLKDLAGRIEEQATATLPTQPDAAVLAVNPLAKIPVLLLDDGTALFDSRVIVEYLDALAEPALLPAAGPERWRVLRQQTLADGVMEAAVLIRYETVLRPEKLRWPDWIAAQHGKLEGALDMLEAEADRIALPLDLGSIAVASALGYLDFRFPAEDWRARPGLARFFAEASTLPEIAATSPSA